MVAAATLSEARGLCEPGTARRIAAVLSAFELPVSVPAEIPTADIMQAMRLDKKVLGGRTRLVLLRAAGEAFVDDTSPPEQVAGAIEACRS